MKQLVIGTAGHIDHGKTALIRALTGFEGDQSDEEKRRGITIDLSFSNLQNEHTNIAFIDVPGHERLVKTMISGAFGFDYAMIVVDVNEGVMPQTKEHLYILNALENKDILVVLTKCDLASREAIETAKQNILNEFKEYENLHIIDILEFSIHVEELVENLKQKLFSLEQKPQIDRGVFRYYIDRVFTIKGSGLVVTGTVLEGQVKVGEKLYVCELGKEGVVKNLQSHNASHETVGIKQRCAINLSNFSQNELSKGMLLTKKGFLRGFKEVDIFFNSKEPTPHNSKITLFSGSKQCEATLLHYEGEEPKSSGFARVVLKDELFLIHDEPLIFFFGAHNIGGAKVLNAVYDPIKKRDKVEFLKALKDKDYLKSFKILSQVHKKGFGIISSYQRFGLTHTQILELLKGCEEFFIDEGALVIYPFETISKLTTIIKNIYQKNQFALLSATSLSLKLSWASQNLAQKALNSLMGEKFIKLNNGVYLKYELDESSIGQKIELSIFQKLDEGGVAPLAPYNIYDELDIERKMGDDALKKLTSAKKVVRLTHNLFITSEHLSEVNQILRDIIKTDGYVDIKNAKDKLHVSRKYLICYLEYLDRFGDIKKVDTRRELR